MSEKKYPTRMHEILGVEPDEVFMMRGETGVEYRVCPNGRIEFRVCPDEKRWSKMANQEFLEDMINRGVVIKPRLTEAQIEYLKAALTLEFGWLAKDEDGDTFLYEGKPKKDAETWTRDADEQCLRVYPAGIGDLVSWDDPEPLDIAATLRAAGVEAEKIEGKKCDI